MVNTDTFNYVDVLTKAADASALRNKTIANNIANIDTPHYKRQDVSFETELRHALKASKYKSLDAKVADANLHLDRLEPRAYTDIPSSASVT